MKESSREELMVLCKEKWTAHKRDAWRGIMMKLAQNEQLDDFETDLLRHECLKKIAYFREKLLKNDDPADSRGIRLQILEDAFQDVFGMNVDEINKEVKARCRI